MPCSGAKHQPEKRHGTSWAPVWPAPAGLLKGASPPGGLVLALPRTRLEPDVERAACTVWR